MLKVMVQSCVLGSVLRDRKKKKINRDFHRNCIFQAIVFLCLIGVCIAATVLVPETDDLSAAESAYPQGYGGYGGYGGGFGGHHRHHGHGGYGGYGGGHGHGGYGGYGGGHGGHGGYGGYGFRG